MSGPMTKLEGNTFPIKDQVKAAGGRWDPAQKIWMVPESEHARLSALIPGKTPRAYKAPEAPNNQPRGYSPPGGNYPPEMPDFDEVCF